MFIALSAVFYYSNLKMVEIVHISSLRVGRVTVVFFLALQIGVSAFFFPM